VPRLTKGETASSIASRSLAAQRNVSHRLDRFNELRAAKDQESEDWSNFVSIETLCGWSDARLGISAISQKTLRKYMGRMYEGGLAALLLDVKKIHVNTKNSRLNSPKINSSDMQRKASMAVDAALDMTARYLDLLQRLQKLGTKSDNCKLELERHFKRYGMNGHLKVLK